MPPGMGRGGGMPPGMGRGGGAPPQQNQGPPGGDPDPADLGW